MMQQQQQQQQQQQICNQQQLQLSNQQQLQLSNQQQLQLSNQQQLQQQMVLCPVRVVYETQILVPPGEQYQPNQTIFINPQNPPPWANQNTTPVVPQNQMLYVQQMPNNIVPSVQQSIDQNQMYIQQAFPNMQPVMNQNVVMTQSTPERQILRQPIQTIQIPNVPPDINTINMNQYAQMINAQNVNMMQAMSNLNQQQLLQQNIQVNMPQMVQQVTNSPRPQMQQIIRSPMPQQQPQQPQNVRPPQQNQVPRSVQQNVSLPQNIVMNQIQNVVQNIASPQLNRSPMMQQNVRQTLVQSIRHNMPQQVAMPKQHVLTNTPQGQRNSPNTFVPQQSNVVRQIIPISMQNNTQQMHTMNAMNTQKNLNNKVPITNLNANINQNQNQPSQIRPRIAPMQPQIRPPMQQMRPMMQMQPIATQTMPQINNQYLRPMNRVVQQEPKPVVYKPNENINKVPPMPTETRKRKSESPDETRNKVSVNSATQVTFEQIRNAPQNNKSVIPKSVSDMGVNTSPVHRPNKTEMKPNTAPPVSVQQGEAGNSMPLLNEIGTPTPEQDKTEKLVRNTVYAQARTRKISNTNVEVTIEQKLNPHVSQTQVVPMQIVPQDMKPVEPVQIKKEIPTEIAKPVTPVKMESAKPEDVHKPEIKIETQRTDIKMDVVKTEIKPQETREPMKMDITKPAYKMEITKPAHKMEIPKIETKKVKDKEEKAELQKSDVKMEVDPPINEVTKAAIKTEEDKIAHQGKKTTDIVKSELKPAKLDEMMKTISSGKEIELSHGRKSEKESFVLTHVLDGIVIQESNVAFPIRIPLREKILPNPPAVKEEAPKREPIAEEPKIVETKSNDSKIMTISKLNIDEENEAGGSQSNKPLAEDNPFILVQPHNVRAWSSEELERHLSKTSWSETASILREHEIDGEALFLVSNTQLQEIGINETHATFLCEFVRS